MFKSMIEHPGLAQKTREQLVDIGKTWLDEEGDEDESEQDDHWGEICAAILDRTWLNSDDTTNLIARVTNRIREVPLHEEVEKALKSAMNALNRIPEDKRGQYELMLRNASDLRQEKLVQLNSKHGDEDRDIGNRL